MIGDLIASFTKRRLGMWRGTGTSIRPAELPVGAVALIYMAGFTVTPVTFIKLANMSGAKHVIACKLKLKRTMVKALTGGNV
jgi:hypothetical protein